MSILTSSRRRFLASTLATVAALPLRRLLAQATKGTKTPHHLAIPSADQLAWQDLEVGMFVHFAPNTWTDKEGDDLTTPLSEINPDIDTDNWAECAVNLGARYIVFVAKHIGGFCMWQTETTPYSIGHTPWKGGHGDVLQDLSVSCKKYGLKLGVYLSPRDEYFGAGLSGVCKDPKKQAAYNAMYREQLTEVLTRYGQMVEVWFDGSSVVPTSDILHRYASHAAIFQGPDATIRWVGNEDGFAPLPLWDAVSEADARSGVATSLHGDPNGTVWLPTETDVSIRRPYWFWSTKNVDHLLTEEQLIEIYYRSVGRGSQLLLNIPANRQGHMSNEDYARTKEFGTEIQRRFGNSVAEISGSGKALELTLPKPQDLDHVILQEDCRYGQRVLGYRVDGNVNNQWRTLYIGTSIGHKRIIAFPPAQFSALRFVVIDSLGEVRIRRFAAFETQSAPPKNWDAPAQIWSSDTVGHWEQSKFDVDLTRKITAATQYRLRFVAQSGMVTAVENAQLLLDGVPSPKFIRPEPRTKDSLLLNFTGIGQKVSVSGTIVGAERGTILLQKL